MDKQGTTQESKTATPLGQVERLVRPNFNFLLHFWGEIMNDNLIEKEIGIKGNYLWFPSKKERYDGKKILKQIADRHNVCIVFSEENGEHVKKKTIAVAVYEYGGKIYQIEKDFGYGFPPDTARYMFEDGNYSCDCNVSIFIHEKYPEFDEIYECGNSIVMKKLDIVYRV